MPLASVAPPNHAGGDAGAGEARPGLLGLRAAATWTEAALAGLAGTLASLLYYGFSGARWVDAPILRSFMDPRLFANDPFVAPFHALTPAAIPYRLLAFVAVRVSSDSLDPGLLVLYLPCTLAALALVYALAWRLFEQRASALAALALSLSGMRLLSIGSPTLHSAEMTPQVLALPFELGGLLALLVDRPTLAGLLLGLAFNLHAPIAGQLGLLFGGWLLLRWRVLGPAAAARAGLAAALAASPTLVGAALSHLRPLEPWEIMLALETTGSDLSVARSFDSRALALMNLVGIAFLGLLAARVRPRRGWALLGWLLAGSALLLLAGLLAVDVLDAPALATVALRLNVARAAWLPNLIGALLLGEYARQGWERGWPPRLLLLALLGAALTVPAATLPLEPLLPATMLLVLAAELVAPAAAALPARTGALSPWLRRLCDAATALLLLACLGLGLRGTGLGNALDLRLALPAVAVTALLGAGLGLGRLVGSRVGGVQRVQIALLALAFVGLAVDRNLEDWRVPVKAGERPARAVIAWARTTPPESEFLIAPSDPFALEFLRRADRAVFVVREGANHGLYFPQNNVEFARRVRALGVQDPLRFPDELDAAYKNLTADDVRAIARDFGVRYFIPAPGERYPFPSAFRADKYVVYRIEP